MVICVCSYDRVSSDGDDGVSHDCCFDSMLVMIINGN